MKIISELGISAGFAGGSFILFEALPHYDLLGMTLGVLVMFFAFVAGLDVASDEN